MKKNATYRKFKKLLIDPELFFRDLLMKRRPPIYNEIGCNVYEEGALISSNNILESLLPNEISVDVVFTWVDDGDPIWRQKRQENLLRCGGAPEFLNARSSARFRNHNELTYSVHSVLTYMPWVRSIYIVTDGQRPRWDKIDKKIKFVAHEELISSEYLPTFNSHVIEAHLHKIAGLSECFIYFNDDVFAARGLVKGHFFSSNGLAVVFPSGKRISSLLERGIRTATIAASINSSELLRNRYGKFIDIPLVHTYVPLRKSAFRLAWNKFEEEIHRFLPNRFRGERDLNVATFLVPWLMYLEGAACLGQDVCHYFNISSPAAPQYYRNLILAQLNGSSPHSFCVNDVSDMDDIPGYKVLFNEFIEEYFGIFPR